ncbi:MAG: hypothetical protein ACRD37_07295, partial [Candidatus Acidiferrales bacterium]
MKHARCYVPIVITVLLLFWCSALSTNAQAPCPSPTPIHRTANGNIFNEQQEVDLGDAISAQLERDFHVVQDEQLNSY